MPFPSPRSLELLQLIDVHRDEWDPGDNTPPSNRGADVIDTFELHHTGANGPKSLSDADKAAWLLGIERYHEGNLNWSDIFYHLFVFADGSIWAGRILTRYSQSNIKTTLTVHVPGNNVPVTRKQHESLLAIAQWCTDDPARVTSHNERAAGTSRPSSCPGSSGIAEVQQLREEITMAEHDHAYQNLGTHADAQLAVANGLWNGSDPTLAASRSVVAVIAQRALAEADENTNELATEVSALRRQVRSLELAAAEVPEDNEIIVTAEVLDVIVAELQRRLAE